MTSLGKWMDLEIIMFSKICQTQSQTLYVFPQMQNLN